MNTDVSERVCCLYRVSNKSQAWIDKDGRADIRSQREVCREFARKNGWEIVDEKQEIGVSGYRVGVDDRPVLQQIKRGAESGKFDILLVSVFDRLGRRADEVYSFAEDLIHIDVHVWSVNEGELRFDSTADRLTNYAVYQTAETESRKSSIRIRTAHEQMVSEGLFHGGPVPYGYRLVSRGVLEIVEEEASVVRLMFDLCVNQKCTGWSIASTLTEANIMDRNGKNWCPSSVRNILNNIVYTGVLRYGEKHSDVIPGLQIIPPELFHTAQTLRMEHISTWNEMKKPSLNITGMALLSGIDLFCGHCGGSLSMSTSGPVRKTMTIEDSCRRRIRYICRGKTQHRTNCDGQTAYTGHKLDDMVEDAICRTLDESYPLDVDRLPAVSDVCTISRQLEAAEAEVTKTSADCAEIKERLEGLRSGGNLRIIAVISDLYEKTQRNLSASEAKVSNLKNQLAQSEMHLEKMQQLQCRIQSRFQNWKDVFSGADISLKKEVAKLLIRKITVRSGYQLNIEFNPDISLSDLARILQRMASDAMIDI